MVLPGLALGVLAGRAFLASYSTDEYRLDLVVRPATLVLSALAILAVAASRWPSLRAVRRLDIAAVVGVELMATRGSPRSSACSVRAVTISTTDHPAYIHPRHQICRESARHCQAGDRE